MRTLRRILPALLLLMGIATLPAKPPVFVSEARADSQRLDRLEQVFFTTTPQFGEAFWRASKSLADERGAAIVHAVMRRSRRWIQMEGMMYMPLVALLPRKETKKLLARYQRVGVERERLAARELAMEVEANDMIEGVRRYGGRD